MSPRPRFVMSRFVMPRFLLCCTLLCVAAAAPAQTGKPHVEKDFRDKVIGKRFFLHGFSADPQVDFTWTDSGLTLTPPQLHTVAVFIPASVVVSADAVRIQGVHHTLARKPAGDFILTGQAPVTIVVHLNGASPQKALPLLADLVFFTDFKDAIASLPPLYRDLLPYRQRAPEEAAKAGSPSDLVAAGCPAGKESFHKPHLLQHVEPQSSKEALAANAHGGVQLVFTVDTTGHVVEPWVSVPVGYGLEEAAAAAALQYIFRPGTCGTTPVAVPLVMNISF